MQREHAEQSVTQVPVSKGRRLWRWSKVLFKGLVGLLVSSLLTGLIYQVIATKLDDSKYPAPGQLIDVGGHRLHLNCTGAGITPVILDSGLGEGAMEWELVQPEVAKFARVCSYDRAGLGWSDAGPNPRTSQQIDKELRALLKNAGIAGPYVLVGHSIGGIHLQLYASQFPEEVAGLVLVDSTHASQWERKEMPKIPSALPLLFKVLAPLGVPRLLNKALASSQANLSSEMVAKKSAVYCRTRHLNAAADELSAVSASVRQVHDAPMQLGNKPLIVLTRGKKDSMPGLSRVEADRVEVVWNELQNDLATRSQNSKHLIAEHSGHMIPLQQPALVVEAIRQMLIAAQQNIPLAKLK